MINDGEHAHIYRIVCENGDIIKFDFDRMKRYARKDINDLCVKDGKLYIVFRDGLGINRYNLASKAINDYFEFYVEHLILDVEKEIE